MNRQQWHVAWVLVAALALSFPAFGHDRDGLTPDAGAARVTNPMDRASVGGKYRTLLREIRVPQDRGSYGYFTDYGHSTTASWGGHDNLPPGYWVYVYPNWYIWGETVPKP